VRAEPEGKTRKPEVMPGNSPEPLTSDITGAAHRISSAPYFRGDQTHGGYYAVRGPFKRNNAEAGKARTQIGDLRTGPKVVTDPTTGVAQPKPRAANKVTGK
jgi:hypothetical protein